MNRKLKMLLVGLVCICLVLSSGCSLIMPILAPDEYTDGVRLDRDYPDKELPIYDDAIVYSCEAEDDEIEIMLGTEDDIDDVIDFYMDFFEDEEIVLDAEEEDRDAYEAQGVIDNFEFELEIELPKREWEERLYETVVKINIVFKEEAKNEEKEEQTPVNDDKKTEITDDEQEEAIQKGITRDDVLGAWLSFRVEDSNGNVYDEVTEYFEFFQDGTGIYYTYNAEADRGSKMDIGWQLDEQEITLSYDDGYEDKAIWSIEEGTDVLTFSLSDGMLYTIYVEPTDPWVEFPTGDESAQTSTSQALWGAWKGVAQYKDGELVNDPMRMVYFDDGVYTRISTTGENGCEYYVYDYLVDGDILTIYNGDTETNLKVELFGDTLILSKVKDGVEHRFEFVRYTSKYGIIEQEDGFNSYGCWLYKDSDYSSYGSVSYWPDGTGKYASWEEEEINIETRWEYDQGLVYESMADGDAIDPYMITQLGDFYIATYEGHEDYIYYRAEERWLSGYLYMMETNEESLAEWTLDLSMDGSLHTTINQTYESDGADTWYIDRNDGRLYILLNGSEPMSFDYLYTWDGIELYDPYNGWYYIFKYVG